MPNREKQKSKVRELTDVEVLERSLVTQAANRRTILFKGANVEAAEAMKGVFKDLDRLDADDVAALTALDAIERQMTNRKADPIAKLAAVAADRALRELAIELDDETVGAWLAARFPTTVSAFVGGQETTTQKEGKSMTLQEAREELSRHFGQAGTAAGTTAFDVAKARAESKVGKSATAPDLIKAIEREFKDDPDLYARHHAESMNY